MDNVQNCDRYKSLNSKKWKSIQYKESPFHFHTELVKYYN
jgi:hypothetical protein